MKGITNEGALILDPEVGIELSSWLYGHSRMGDGIIRAQSITAEKRAITD